MDNNTIIELTNSMINITQFEFTPRISLETFNFDLFVKKANNANNEQLKELRRLKLEEKLLNNKDAKKKGGNKSKKGNSINNSKLLTQELKKNISNMSNSKQTQPNIKNNKQQQPNKPNNKPDNKPDNKPKVMTKKQGENVQLIEKKKEESNKDLNSFLKSLKEKNVKEKEVKVESIKQTFLKKYGLFFSLDIMNRLSLKEGCVYQVIFLEFILKSLEESIILNSTNTDMIKQSLKESLVLIDCLIDMSLFDDSAFKETIEKITETITKAELISYSTIHVNFIYSIITSMIKSDKSLSIKDCLISYENKLAVHFISNVSIDMQNTILYTFLTMNIITQTSKYIELFDAYYSKRLNNIEANISNFKCLSSIYNTFDSTVKSSIYNLSMKTTKYIEGVIKDSQDSLINNILIQKLYTSIYINSILIFNSNFASLYNKNENLNEDLIEIINFIHDKPIIIKDISFLSNIIANFNIIEDDRRINDDITIKMLQINIYNTKIYDKLLLNLTDNSDINKTIQYIATINNLILTSIFTLKSSEVKDRLIDIMKERICAFSNNNKNDQIIINLIIADIEKTIDVVSSTSIRIKLDKIENKHPLIKAIKLYKEFKGFYINFDFIKPSIINLINESKATSSLSESYIQESIRILLLLNYISKTDIEKYNISNDELIKSLLFFNNDLISNYLLYYATQEINYMTELNSYLIKSLNLNISNYLLKTISLNDDYSIIEKCLEIYSKLISNKKMNIDSIKDDILLIINNSIIIKDNEIKLLIIFYLLEKVLSLCKKDDDLLIFNYLNGLYEDTISSANGNISNTYNVNDDTKKINDKQVDYNEALSKYSINSLSDLKFIFSSILNFSVNYIINPESYKQEDIEVVDNEKDSEAKSTSITNINLLLDLFMKILHYMKSNINEIHLKSNILVKSLSIVQSVIVNLLSRNLIFSQLTSTPTLLESFITEYIKNDKVSNSDIITQANKEEVSINTTSLLQLPKLKNKIVLLFKEENLYEQLLSSDTQFLNTLSHELEESYKKTILNTDLLDKQLKVLQAEETEFEEMNTLIEKIFSSKVMSFIKFPDELFNFIQNSSDQLKYDIKSEKKSFYSSLYSYFFTWRTIMSKIEYGFKLYTTNKSYVDTIDKYKTLLKFIIDYFQRNSHFYEMFLLSSLSLLQLIENNLNIDLHDSTDRIIKGMKDPNNDSKLKYEINEELFIFIATALFKFVKIFPSLVRFWSETLQGKLKFTFKNLIYKLILPQMTEELRQIFNNNKAVLAEKGIKIKDYSIDNSFFEFDLVLNEEIRFNVQVKIPLYFPLSKLETSFVSNAHIPSGKELNIKMNLNQAINMSTDNICDNLLMWADNCKQFLLMNTEPCPICYYYLHNTDKSLPTLTCKKCKKVFHSLCMKEWFKSSAQSSGKTNCPMCRSEWVMKGQRDLI